ncbi:MAG: hypothetical protein QXG86_02750, partial [Candidatus Woesearchaeota archaeon]
FDKPYNEGGYAIDLGSLGSITLDIDEDCSGGYCIRATDLNAGADNIAETYYGANIEVYSLNELSGSACENNYICDAFTLTEMDLDDQDIEGYGPRAITVQVSYDATNDKQLEFYWTSLPGTEDNDGWVRLGVDKIYDDSDVQVASTAHGTLLEWDAENHKWITILYPQEEVEVNAFVAPISAQISTTGGAIKSLQLEKLNVGAARLASEISDVTKDNLILVGGACANAATAAVQGVTYQAEPECYVGMQPGEAIIKLYEQSTGKVAMVVAGRDALDTRRATRVVANFNAYKLSGKEVKVTGTSLTDIKVSAPS